MALEVELKLSLSPSSAEQFLNLIGFHQHNSLSEVTVKSLENIYFDTESLDLLRSRAALRIRKSGDCYLQTFKTKGKSVGGLHQRGEWEYPIDSPTAGEAPELLPKLFPSDVWPETLSIDALKPVFETNFQRSAWVWTSNQGTRIELVLDQGQVISGEKVTPLCEIELELMEGDPSCLFDLAELLSKCIPVTVSDITKAQRGFELFRPGVWVSDSHCLSLEGDAESQLTALMACIGHKNFPQLLIDDELILAVSEQLISQKGIPEMDLRPWFVLTEMGGLDDQLKGQWLLRLARHAWLAGNV